MGKMLASLAAIAAFGFFVLTGQERPRAVFTEGQAAAGKAAYESSCALCHTSTLVGHDGTGEIPEFLKPYGGKIPPLAGANSAYPPFLTTWGSQTTGDLYRRIRTAVGGFPPPGRRKDDQLFLELTAYVLQVNGAAAGSQVLTATNNVEIRSITAAR